MTGEKFWRSVAVAVISLLVGFIAYYVRVNDEKWRAHDAWKESHITEERAAQVDVVQRLSSIEAKLDAAIFTHKPNK